MNQIIAREVFAGFRKLALACLMIVACDVVAGSAVDQHQLGTKYSPLSQINKHNVAQLEVAWEYHTGDLPPSDFKKSFFAFEDQPSLIEGNLVVCSQHVRQHLR